MNAPTMSPEIQQEAARSLLERLAEKTALVKFFRYNASAKHGVPIDPPSTSGLWTGRRTNESTTTTTTTDTQPTQPVQTTQPTVAVSPQATPANISVNLTQPAAQSPAQATPQSNSDFLKGVLISLATVAGIGGAGYVGYNMANKEPPKVETKVEAPKTEAPKVETQKWPESPYQWLEDRGEHLP